MPRPPSDRDAELWDDPFPERGATPRSWICRRCGADVDSGDIRLHLSGHLAAVTLQAPNGERGVLIGPADRIAGLVRPEAVVPQRRCVRCGSTAVDLWKSWNVVGEWTCAECAPEGFDSDPAEGA